MDRWLDEPLEPSLEGLEKTSFIPMSKDELAQVRVTLNVSTIFSNDLNAMLEAKAQYVVEDYCHVPKDKVYWCRLGR